MTWQIQQSQPDPFTTVLRMEGRLILGPACVQIQSLVDQVLAGNTKRMILDVSDITHMDSTGMGRFIDAHQKLAEAGKSLRIVGAHGGVREMFRVTKLDTVFALYSTVEAALAA